MQFPNHSYFNFQFSIFNFQLSIFNFQISTFNFQFSTFNFQLSTFQYLHFFSVTAISSGRSRFLEATKLWVSTSFGGIRATE